MSKSSTRAHASRPVTDVPCSGEVLAGEVLSGEMPLGPSAMPTWWGERLLRAAAEAPLGEGQVAVARAMLRAGVDLAPDLALTLRMPVPGGWLTVREPESPPAGRPPRVGGANLELAEPPGAELSWTHDASFDLADDGPEMAMLRHLGLALGLALRGVEGAVQSRGDFHARQTQLVQTERLAAVGRLAATTLHEINNPLTTILGYTEFLLRKVERAPLDAADLERLRRIQEAAERVQMLSRGLVDYAHPSPGAPGPVVLRTAIDQALVFCEYTLSDVGVAVERDYRDQGAAVQGIVSEFTQVFVNLIVNACQAMPRGRGLLRLRTEADPHAVVVRIEDNGHGVAPEHAGRLFEPFFTTRPLGSGTGLGLSIVRTLVERHGGTVSVDSEAERGTVFVVRLPRLPRLRGRGRASVRHPALQLVRRHGLGEVEALHLVAAERPQELELGLDLDALGDDLEAEAVAEGQDGAGDGHVLDVERRAAHELAVDLDDVHRKPLDVRERGVAGAEVVDRDRDAELAQLLQPLAHLGRALEQEALGDLDAEQPRGQPGLGEGALAHGPEVVARQLPRRRVDAHLQLEAGALP
ncbi:MAG: hypothetical protein EOO75_11355, partial [Myxococcales bacterium]